MRRFTAWMQTLPSADSELDPERFVRMDSRQIHELSQCAVLPACRFLQLCARSRTGWGVHHRRGWLEYRSYAFVHDEPERRLREAHASGLLRHRRGLLSQRWLLLGFGQSSSAAGLLAVQRVDRVDDAIGAVWDTVVGEESQ